MNIQLASDLHLELLAEKFPGEHLVALDPRADVLVLAGDIARPQSAVAHFRDSRVPIVMVMGNHEAYGSEIYRAEDRLRKAARGTTIPVLQRDSIENGRTRFVGCTPWTDNARDLPSENVAYDPVKSTELDKRVAV